MRPASLSFTARLPSLHTMLIVVALAAPFIIFWDTLLSMVEIWDRSETFTHQYLIMPISLWLIWRKRSTLRALRPTLFVPALIPLALCSFGWLLGGLADVEVIKQFAFVGMLISTVVTVTGLRIAKVIAFPLLFLLLAVPFGEIFIGPLIEFTANFTIAALKLTGIPVWREGATFVIPSGRWSVVEACSGVRYLIASVTLGVLYAHMSYRSNWRKAAFVLVSIVVPVIANGLRAYMIVMIGHLSSMQLAVGVDHLIYGWLFFGLVMFLMFWIGNFWVDPDATLKHAETPPTPTLSPADPMRLGPLLLCLLATLACLGIGPIYASYMARADTASAPLALTQVQSSWNDGKAFSDWMPDFHPGVADLNRFYQHDGQQVGLFLRYYRNQHPGATLVSSVNRILIEKHSPWTLVDSDIRSETLSGRQLQLREEIIKGPKGDLLIWHWYWIDRGFVENDYLAKLLQSKSQLEMHGDDGAALFAYTPLGEHAEQARQVLRNYLSENLASIEATLNNSQR